MESLFWLTDFWKKTYPDAHVGMLVMGGVTNPPVCPDLERGKRALESALCTQFAGEENKLLAEHPVIQVYEEYYRRFRKTYHVRLQLESIVYKGKTLPRVSALVEAMFMAELKNFLLTAGHDMDKVSGSICVTVSGGDETYISLRGTEQRLKEGDMMMADREGVISSVIYGPDDRTKITPKTRNVLFTVYAPAGITARAVDDHLRDIRENVLIVAPGAETKEFWVNMTRLI